MAGLSFVNLIDVKMFPDMVNSEAKFQLHSRHYNFGEPNFMKNLPLAILNILSSLYCLPGRTLY